ncbi:TPA: hypothetical protein ACPJ09_000945 [Vibrio diabolicus]
MKTTLIDINDLVAHESMATSSRVSKVKGDDVSPIVVKPVMGTNKYYIVDGTNRAYKALLSKKGHLNTVVATPDSSARTRLIMNHRISVNSMTPLANLKLAHDDIERQHQFFLDTDSYSKRPVLNSNRGTMIKLKVTVAYDEKEDIQFTLSQKGDIGGLLLQPKKAVKLFNTDYISEDNIFSCWGDEKKYDASVLPSYIELGNDGSDCWAGGYALRQAFRDSSSSFDGSEVKQRGRVTAINVFVIYPNGLVFEGPINVNNETVMVLWSEHLVNKLADINISKNFSPSNFWWRNPTSLIVGERGLLFGCPTIEHSCGSTCVGGGCLV